MLNLTHIAFETTDCCNLNCIYCYNIWKAKYSNVHTPFNSYKKAVAALDKLFAQAAIQHVAFTGGEPFLAERYAEVILFCRMKGKSVTVISNGTQGSKSDYKQLLKMGVSLFEFPVHSYDSKTHDKMVGVNGSWQKSVTSVKKVLDLGGRAVPVIVITKYNVNQLGETLDFISSLGCSRIMLNRYNIGGKACSNPMDVSASAKELRDAFAIANDKALESGLNLTANVCSPICLLNPADYPFIGFGHCSFDVLRRPITLDINGNIRLCNHSPVVAGNIFKEKLYDILYSDYTKEWEMLVPEFCRSCIHWSRCKGGCRAASEQCGQTLMVEDPIIKGLHIEKPYQF